MKNSFNLGNDLYIHGRIGWRGLSKDEYLEKSDYRIINATALMDGYVDWNNCGFITKERYDESNEIQLEEGDILISKDGTLGKVGYVKNMVGKCTVASGIFVLRNTIPDRLDFDYLYHILKSHVFKDFIRRNKAQGSTIPHLYQRDLENFELELPSIETQRKVAKILNTLDGKIEINNRINDNLQKQLELSFDYYFNNPLTSKKWKSGVLSDIATITMGQSPSGDSYNNVGDGTPFYQGSTDFGTIFPMIRMYTTAPSRMAEKLDTLLSVRAPVGTMNVSFEKCCIGRGLAAIQGNNDNNIFVRYLLKRNQWYFDNINNSGTTFGSITKDYLYKMPITIPDDMSIKRFEDNAKTLEYQIYNREKEIRTLSSIRNWLLPMLMNGQAIIVE